MFVLFHVYCQDERVEASDIVTATLENTGWGPTKIATQIKMSYDQSFGAAWQVGHTVLLQMFLLWNVLSLFPGGCGWELQCESWPRAALPPLHVQRQPLHHCLEVWQRPAQGVMVQVLNNADCLFTVYRKYNTSLTKRMRKRRRQHLDARK